MGGGSRGAGGGEPPPSGGGFFWSTMVCCQRTPLPHCLSADVRQRIVTVILRSMSDATPAPLCLPPPPPPPCRILWASPYFPVHYTPASVSSRAQQVLAWLVWRDPRVVLWRAEGLSVNIPRRTCGPPVVRGYVVQACDSQRCFLHEPPGSGPVQVVCTPGGGRLQLVLMRHPPPSYLPKLAGGGGGSWGGGGWRGVGGGGIGSLAGGGGAAHNLLLSHAFLRGVSGGMGV